MIALLSGILFDHMQIHNGIYCASTHKKLRLKKAARGK